MRHLAFSSVVGAALLVTAATSVTSTASAPEAVDELRGQSTYRAIELDPLGSDFSSAHMINDRGHVAGTAHTVDQTGVRTFLWQRGTSRVLDTLGRPYSGPGMISDRGHVFYFASAFDGRPSLNLVWYRGRVRDLGSLGVMDMNRWGWLVGGRAEETSGGTRVGRATLRRWGQTIDLTPPHDRDRDELTSTVASMINDRGDVVIEVHNLPEDPNVRRAYLWREGVFTELVTCFCVEAVIDLNERGEVLGFDHDQAPTIWRDGVPDSFGIEGYFVPSAMNDAGWVVGTWSPSPTDQRQEAVLWRGGTVTTLTPYDPDVTSMAVSVSDRGHVAGFSANDLTKLWTAWVWRNGELTYLPHLPGATSSSPDQHLAAVNDRGEVVGYSEVPDRQRRGVVWVPTAER